MDKIERMLKIAASTIALVVPAILLAGYSYHLGYSITFGLSTDLISKNISDVIAESWYVGLSVLAWAISKWLYVLLFIIFLFVVFLLFLWGGLKLKDKGYSWLFEEISKENQGRKILGIFQWHWILLGRVFNELLSWFFYPFAMLCILGLFTVEPFKYGENNAITMKKSYRENGCQCQSQSKYSCINLLERKNNEVVAKGILVSADDNHIAIYDNEIEVWPLLDIYYIKKNKLVQKDVDKINKK